MKISGHVFRNKNLKFLKTSWIFDMKMLNLKYKLYVLRSTTFKDKPAMVYRVV